jgi:hypothetical protein
VEPSCLTSGTPTFGKKRNLESDNFVGFDIYTHKAITNYNSGTMFHWDGMVIQYFAKRGSGSVRSDPTLTQITDDTGPLAETLHGP